MRKYLIVALGLLAAGCATRPPEFPPPPPPAEPLEVEAEELEVVIIDVTEIEEEAEIAVEPEEGIPAPPRDNLSWEEIAGLGEEYTIAPGDTLSGIAARHNVGTGLLIRLNNIADPNLIRVGRKLMVIDGPFRVEVDKSERTLDVFLGDSFIRSYPVALGKRDSTPEGEFQVLRKLENPPWTDPYNRTIVTADDPEYPLGTRWIEFIPPPGAYGIHGSRVAEEIGTEASFGCVRLLHPQEEEVYDFLTLGSPILIQP
ncbi:MAG: L,D-transpeptidase family protein [Candidatus Erginobacter occultus]|nr:L,D-transpeptidase family protein [Candidatus Erginobacter occultus]